MTWVAVPVLQALPGSHLVHLAFQIASYVLQVHTRKIRAKLPVCSAILGIIRTRLVLILRPPVRNAREEDIVQPGEEASLCLVQSVLRCFNGGVLIHMAPVCSNYKNSREDIDELGKTLKQTFGKTVRYNY